MTQLWQNWVMQRYHNLRTLATKPHSVQVTTLTCFSAALQNWQRSIRSPEMTERWSSGDSDGGKKEKVSWSRLQHFPQRGSWGLMTTSWWKRFSGSLLNRDWGSSSLWFGCKHKDIKSRNHPPGRGSQIFWKVGPSEPTWPGFHCLYISCRVSSQSPPCWSDCPAPAEAEWSPVRHDHRKHWVQLHHVWCLVLPFWKSGSPGLHGSWCLAGAFWSALLWRVDLPSFTRKWNQKKTLNQPSSVSC